MDELLIHTVTIAKPVKSGNVVTYTPATPSSEQVYIQNLDIEEVLMTDGKFLKDLKMYGSPDSTIQEGYRITYGSKKFIVKSRMDFEMDDNPDIEHTKFIIRYVED